MNLSIKSALNFHAAAAAGLIYIAASNADPVTILSASTALGTQICLRTNWHWLDGSMTGDTPFFKSGMYRLVTGSIVWPLVLVQSIYFYRIGRIKCDITDYVKDQHGTSIPARIKAGFELFKAGGFSGVRSARIFARSNGWIK